MAAPAGNCMLLSETSRTLSVRALNRAAHSAFVPIGMVTVLLGPLLPTLSARWALNFAQAGSPFTAQFFGCTVGAGLSGVIVSRWGFRFAINGGLFAMAVGVAILPFSSHYPGLICIACYGAGLGLAIPAANLLVAAINPQRRSAALSVLNFSWSAGAVACPFVVAIAAKFHKIEFLLMAIAGFLILVLFRIAAMPRGVAEPSVACQRDSSNVPRINWRQPSLLVLSALFFFYVGAENAFGGWIASYARGLPATSPTASVMTPSLFYAAAMIGRWMAPVVLRNRDETTIARGGLAVACLGMAGMILSRTLPFVMSSAALAGIGLAGVYPITISILSQEFGAEAARVGSFMFTMANFGGALLPWMVGYCSYRFDDLRVGLAVPLASTVLMYILYQFRFSTGEAKEGKEAMA